MIELINLSKSYKSKNVLNAINETFSDNTISFIMGENGVGKTTLLKCILNLENYKGNVLFSQKELGFVRNDIHVIYDDSPLYLNLNGFQNIELLINKRHSYSEIREVALKYLNEETLKAKVKGFSYGQRKKISLIIAELNQPKYLFLDEVSNGLDYDTMQMLKVTLKEWSSRMNIVATGHQFDFYADIIDDLYILKDGGFNKIDFNIEGRDLGEIYQRFAK